MEQPTGSELQHPPCDVGHGAERVVTLSDGDAGHLVHGQDGGLLLGQHVHQLRVLSRVDEADQRGRVLQHLHLVEAQGRVEGGGTHLEACLQDLILLLSSANQMIILVLAQTGCSYLHHHVRSEDIFNVFDGGSGLRVMLVRELGRLSSAGLHDHVEALLDEGLDPSGRDGHAPFILENLFGDTNCELFVRNTCGGRKRGEGLIPSSTTATRQPDRCCFSCNKTQEEYLKNQVKEIFNLFSCFLCPLQSSSG